MSSRVTRRATSGDAALLSRFTDVNVWRRSSVQEWFLRLAGKKLEPPRAGQPVPAERFIAWHRKQVFRAPARVTG